MKRNYNQRLDNLRKRRVDEALQRAVLSESFADIKIGDSVKYALESMRQIDAEYTKNTYLASEKIQKNLTPRLAAEGIHVEYRHQGSVETNTHIRLYSDIDILVLTKRFHSLEPPLQPQFPYYGDPCEDLSELRRVSHEILASIYDQVDDSKAKAIQVFPTSPKRKVDIVPANWLDTTDYQQFGLEKFRAIHIYNRDANNREKDVPFLHMSNVKEKDNRVNGNLARIIRILKTLKVDADYEINLSSFEITSLAYGINDAKLFVHMDEQLLLLNVASGQLGELINNKAYRENLKSPNNTEFVFGTSEVIVVELRKLKLEMDELIQDITEELATQFKKLEEKFIYT